MFKKNKVTLHLNEKINNQLLLETYFRSKLIYRIKSMKISMNVRVS